MREIATFAGGCFWCTEAIFERLKGVESVVCGYAGGQRKTPNYEQVSTGATGHAEAVHVTFNSTIISYKKLLEVFFATHNPTTMNRQGADIGTQYRSVIFYHSKEQKNQAKEMIEKLSTSGVYKDPIVTQVVPYEAFYKAEDYHQNFYNNNKEYPYCQVVINPKIQKLLKEFGSDVKEE